MNCMNCNKPTINPKFCNRSCSATWINKHYPKRKKKIRRCLKCKSNYTYGDIISKYCIDCCNYTPTKVAQRMTLKELHNKTSVKGKHPSWINAHVRINNKSWNRSLTNLSCQNCEYSLHVELCHIKSITSFPDSATLGEINDPNNILVLCRNCHWEFDNEYLKLESIPKRK